jgi:hypothetical protein
VSSATAPGRCCSCGERGRSGRRNGLRNRPAGTRRRGTVRRRARVRPPFNIALQECRPANRKHHWSARIGEKP